MPIYELPLAEDGHGWTEVDGFLEPLWSNGPIMPMSVVDLIGNTVDENLDDDDTDYNNDILDYLNDESDDE